MTNEISDTNLCQLERCSLDQEPNNNSNSSKHENWHLAFMHFEAWSAYHGHNLTVASVIYGKRERKTRYQVWLEKWKIEQWSKDYRPDQTIELSGNTCSCDLTIEETEEIENHISPYVAVLRKQARAISSFHLSSPEKPELWVSSIAPTVVACQMANHLTAQWSPPQPWNRALEHRTIGTIEP